MTCVSTPSGHPDQDWSRSVNVCSSGGQSTAGFRVDPYIEVKGQMEVKVK